MTAGVTFKETMEGWFALDAETPKAGADRGRHEGTRLAMHAEVAIADLERFMAERDHPGSLSGVIDFQPLGFGLNATTGVFQLFAPGPREDSRRMVYELAFEADGEPYYLAGEKRVRNDAGADLWRDTTTLYAHLYRGQDSNGPIVGCGILTLGVRQLVALLSTLRPSGDGDLGTTATFGRFFFGELWELYAPGARR